MIPRFRCTLFYLLVLLAATCELTAIAQQFGRQEGTVDLSEFGIGPNRYWTDRQAAVAIANIGSGMLLDSDPNLHLAFASDGILILYRQHIEPTGHGLSLSIYRIDLQKATASSKVMSMNAVTARASTDMELAEVLCVAEYLVVRIGTVLSILDRDSLATIASIAIDAPKFDDLIDVFTTGKAEVVVDVKTGDDETSKWYAIPGVNPIRRLSLHGIQPSKLSTPSEDSIFRVENENGGSGARALFEYRVGGERVLRCREKVCTQGVLMISPGRFLSMGPYGVAVLQPSTKSPDMSVSQLAGAESCTSGFSRPGGDNKMLASFVSSCSTGLAKWDIHVFDLTAMKLVGVIRVKSVPGWSELLFGDHGTKMYWLRGNKLTSYHVGGMP